MKSGLSVVIPAYNAAPWIVETIQKTEAAIRRAGYVRYEVIVVNDGSSDDTLAITKKLAAKNKHLKVLTHTNRGRFLTRKRGVDQAEYDRILFVDVRTWLDESSLDFLKQQLKKHPDRRIWNAHINVVKKGNLIARFGDVVTMLGWRRYFKNPRLSSYGLKEFDHYPKGTGLFTAPIAVIVEAIKWFETQTKDVRNSSDDTLLIRHMAESERIWLSPRYSGSYFARTKFRDFLRHTYDRGRFFVDGFLRPGTRFFYPLITCLAVSVIMAAVLIGLAFWQPLWVAAVIGVGVVVSLLAGLLVVCMGISLKDGIAFGLLLPFFTIAYLLGIWRAVLHRSLLGTSTRVGRGLAAHRCSLNGSIREYLVIALLYLVIAIPSTGFVFFHISHQIFSGPGDATAGFLWLNSIDHSINPTVGSTQVMNYPFGEQVGGWTLVSYFAYWMPMRILSYFSNPIVAVNIMMYVGYVGAALSMYWLIKRLTGKRLIAFFAGYAVAFVPYAMTKSIGHMSYIFSGIFSIIIGVFLAFWKKPNLKKAILLGLSFAVAMYTDGYFILMALIVALALAIAACMHIILHRFSRREIVSRLGFTLAALAAFIVFVAPLIGIQLFYGREVSSQLSSNRSDIGSEIRAYRSNIADFVIPPYNSSFLGTNPSVLKAHDYNNLRSNGSENNDFISPVLYVFAAIAVVLMAVRLLMRNTSSLADLSESVWRDATLAVLGCTAIAILAISFMFSPEITVHGVTIPLPGKLFIKENIALWRVLSRLFVIFNVAVVTLASVGLWLLLTKWTKAGWVYRKWAGIVLGLVVVITTFFYISTYPTRPFDFSTGLDKTYYWLRDQASIKSIVELPVVDPLDIRSGDYATAQIIHKKDVMNLKEPNMIRLANSLGSIDNPELVNMIRDRGIDAIIYRSVAPCPTLTWATIIHVETNVPYYDQGRPKKVNLCTYRVVRAAADGAFIRFGNGFTPSANAANQTNVVFQEGANGEFFVTTDDLTSPYLGKTKLTTYVHDVSQQGKGWVLEDSRGRVVTKGTLEQTATARTGQVTAQLTTPGPYRLFITGSARPIPLGGVYLSNTVVTAASL